MSWTKSSFINIENVSAEAEEILVDVITDSDDDDIDIRKVNTEAESSAKPSTKTDSILISKDNIRVNCPFCSDTFARKANIKRHIQRKHKDNSADVGYGKTLCLECGAKFHRVIDLKSHLSKEHEMIFKNESLVFGTRKGM